MPNDLTPVMYSFARAVKEAGAEYECAAELLEPFDDGTESPIKTAAGTARVVYADLVRVDREILAEMLALLDGKTSGPGALGDRMSDLSLAKNQTWKALALAAGMLTFALVDRSGKPDEKLSRLTITGEERGRLLQQLERTFGPSVRESARAGQPAVVFAAGTLHQFLANPAWKVREGNDGSARDR